MNMTFAEVLIVVNLLLVIAGVIGALFVFRKTYVKELGMLQGRMLEAYKADNQRLLGELKRTHKELTSIRLALKQIGLTIEIDGDLITIIDEQKPKPRRVTQVRMEPGEEEEAEKPA